LHFFFKADIKKPVTSMSLLALMNAILTECYKTPRSI
jgi:hypothetical protein